MLELYQQGKLCEHACCLCSAANAKKIHERPSAPAPAAALYANYAMENMIQGGKALCGAKYEQSIIPPRFPANGLLSFLSGSCSPVRYRLISNIRRIEKVHNQFSTTSLGSMTQIALKYQSERLAYS